MGAWIASPASVSPFAVRNADVRNVKVPSPELLNFDATPL